MQNKNERAVFLTLYAVVSNKCGSAKRAAWFGKLEQKSHSIDKCLRFLPLGLLCYVMLCSLVSKEAFEPSPDLALWFSQYSKIQMFANNSQQTLKAPQMVFRSALPFSWLLSWKRFSLVLRPRATRAKRFLDSRMHNSHPYFVFLTFPCLRQYHVSLFGNVF